MNFFEAQEQAQRHTTQLVVLFVLAVIGVIVGVYGLAAVLVAWAEARRVLSGTTSLHFWDASLFFKVASVTLITIWAGSLYKLNQLRRGGSAVAEALGGVPVDGHNAGPLERRLLNVVEEMAIASGSPMPAVYVLPGEEGINAFAAGHTIDDAAIAVTRGTLEQLTRDELQGVIAHEFSHIFHGDMRLNMRLMGWVHGILLLALIGQELFRALSRPRLGSRRNSKDGGIILVVMFAALGLIVVGFSGVFFGNLIKATVNRQREYLADASAVKFTRYPDGIAGVLKKIGGFKSHSELSAPKASQVSHMFFARGVSGFVSNLFATHPPLPDRIRRIQPNWDGTFPERWPVQNAAVVDDQPRARSAAAVASSYFAGTGAATPAATSALDSVGTVSDAHLAFAQELLTSLPTYIVEAARDPYLARPLVYALLLAKDVPTRDAQFAELVRAEPRMKELRQYAAANIPEEALLPLIDIALPALRRLATSQRADFLQTVGRLIAADGVVSLLEWVMQTVLQRHVAAPVPSTRVHRHIPSLDGLREELGTVLSALAWAGHADPAEVRMAFDAGVSTLGMSHVPFHETREVASLPPLTAALAKLNRVAPRLKQHVLAACAACISFDRSVTVIEAELFRGIADHLGCPVPPMLPGQPLA